MIFDKREDDRTFQELISNLEMLTDAEANAEFERYNNVLNDLDKIILIINNRNEDQPAA